MTPPLCYVAAPYSGPSPTIVAWHVARARLLARLALACGYAPFEPHSSIAAGVYGDDSDPEQRARGMAATAAICRGVLATPGAVLWALLRDDGTMSDGTRAEWMIAEGVQSAPRVGAWNSWRGWADEYAPHLLPEWDRLAVRPGAVGGWQAGARRYGDGTKCAARVNGFGWFAWRFDGTVIGWGVQDGAAGRDAADRALRAAGVMR